jgi:hypothetical protein
MGVVLLADVILAKTLSAPGWHVTLLATLGSAANLLSFYWAGWVQGRRKSASFLLAVLIGRLPLFLLLGLQTSGWMLFVNFLYSVGTALLITSSNAIFQSHYPECSPPARSWSGGSMPTRGSSRGRRSPGSSPRTTSIGWRGRSRRRSTR